jgi:hypothetical protein
LGIGYKNPGTATLSASFEFNLNKVSRLHESTSSVGTKMQHTQSRLTAALTWKNAIIIAAVQRSDTFLRAAGGCGGG